MAYDTEETKGGSAFDDVVANAQNQSAQASQGERPDGVQDVKIIMWQNGFQINDDGEFRDITTGDERNMRFLEELKQGNVPSEMRTIYPKGCSVALEDKRSQTYTPPPPPKYISFSGEGQSMGGAAQSTGGAVDLNATGGKPVVDESQPKTSIQFRFHNGQRAAIEVNMSHKVSDLYTYVEFVAPVEGSYQLLSGFPPKPITDPNATIESAGLARGSITQKLV